MRPNMKHGGTPPAGLQMQCGSECKSKQEEQGSGTGILTLQWSRAGTKRSRQRLRAAPTEQRAGDGGNGWKKGGRIMGWGGCRGAGECNGAPAPAPAGAALGKTAAAEP